MIQHEGARSLVDSSTTGHTLSIDPDPPTACRRCGSINVIVTRRTSGVHFARAKCLECNRAWFTKGPWSPERAQRFTMPWGKYRGRHLAELSKTPEGRDYLRWLCAEVEGNVGIAARVILSECGPKTGGSDHTPLETDEPTRFDPCSSRAFRSPGVTSAGASVAREFVAPSGGTDPIAAEGSTQ